MEIILVLVISFVLLIWYHGNFEPSEHVGCNCGHDHDEDPNKYRVQIKIRDVLDRIDELNKSLDEQKKEYALFTEEQIKEHECDLVSLQWDYHPYTETHDDIACNDDKLNTELYELVEVAHSLRKENMRLLSRIYAINGFPKNKATT